MNEVLLIAGMFIVTFGVRYFLFAAAGRIVFPNWLNTALEFVPPVVLMAIVAPAVLLPRGEFWLSYDNPWLLSALLAFGVALWRKNVLLTILVSMTFFMGYKWWLGGF